MLLKCLQYALLGFLAFMLALSLLALVFGSYEDYMQNVRSYSCNSQGLNTNCLNERK